MRLFRVLAMTVTLTIACSAASAQEVTYHSAPAPSGHHWGFGIPLFNPGQVRKPSLHGGRPFGYRAMPSKHPPKEPLYRCGYPYETSGAHWHPYIRSPRDYFMEDRQ